MTTLSCPVCLNTSAFNLGEPFECNYCFRQLDGGNAKLNVPVLVFEKRIGVAVIVRDSNGLILTCQRVACRDMNGLWQFPGGAIEGYESPLKAATRELFEESALWPPVDCFRDLGTGIGITPDGHPHITTFFLCQLARPASVVVELLNREPDKHGPWEWVTVDELLERPIIALMRLFLLHHVAGKRVLSASEHVQIIRDANAEKDSNRELKSEAPRPGS